MAEGMYIMSDNERRKYAKVVSRAWSDNEFAERYNAEPHAVLGEFGIDYPADVRPPVLPTRPAGDFTVEQLEAVSAGVETTVACTGPCYPCGSPGCL